MEQEWHSTSKSILMAGVILFVATFFIDVFKRFLLISSGGSAFEIFTGGGIFSIILDLVVLSAYVWYYNQICEFAAMQTDESDTDAITMVSKAVIVGLVGMICSFIPLVCILIGSLLNTAAAMMLFHGFRSFSKSAVLPQVGKVGADQLKVYAIVATVGAVLALIPLVGTVLGGLCNLAGIIFFIKGWNNVAKGCPDPIPEEEPCI